MDSVCFPFVILCVFFFIVKLTSFTKLSLISVGLILWAILVFILYFLYMVALNLLHNSLGVSHVHYLPALIDTPKGWISTEGFSFLKPTFVSCTRICEHNYLLDISALTILANLLPLLLSLSSPHIVCPGLWVYNHK